MKCFIIGLLRLVIGFISIPILLILGIITMIQVLGGKNCKDRWFDKFEEFVFGDWPT